MSERDKAQNPEPQPGDEAYTLLFEQSGEMVCILDLEGRFTSVNPAGERLTGYPAADLVGRFAAKLIAPELREQAARQFRERLRGDAAPDETVLLTRNGQRVPVLVTANVISHGGRPVGVLGLITDLTARRSAENALSQLLDAEARFRSFFESAPIGEAIVGLDGRFLEVNNALCEIVGYSEAELPAMTFQDITHPDDLDADLEFVRQMLAGEIRIYQMEKRYLHKGGHMVWVLLSVSLVRSRAGTPSYFISQIQDITERRAAEAELRQAELRYRTLVEQLPLGMYIRPVDMSLPNIYASPQVEPMIGYPPKMWENNAHLLASIVHPDDRERVLADAAAVRETGKPSRDEYRYIARDGRVVWVQDETFRLLDEHGEPYVQGFLLDITERKNAEAERDRLRVELHDAQKLEAIGRLAGGVAHDFNNMLTAIKGYSELLLDGLQPGTRLHHEAEQIRRAAEQASSLPEQLLAFARKQPLAAKLVDVNTLVATASVLLRHLIGEQIELITIPAPHPAFAQVDPDRIEQLLVNLALNARDAMPTGGSLTIATSTTEITAETAQDHDETGADRDEVAGSYVVVSVADDGEGMDAETRERAFEPFFTTKPQGKGSGLGLASVHGTVSQSGGFVRVESEPGRGTTVRLYFPAAAAVPVEEAEPHSEPALVVLLAEDEDIVRELVSSVLEREGFEVHAARDGLEALEQLERIDRPIDLLVTDLVMPRMSGQELAERVAERQPQARTVFISGYSEESPTLERGALGESAFVRKPFSPSALVQTVNSVITRTRSSSRPARPNVDADQVTCVIADDHPAVLDSVSRYLEMAGIGVVARVSRADEALREIESHRPLTALVDITMEPFNGIEVARRAAVSSPETGIVLYTGHHDHALLREALDAGARGFVLKATPLSELVTALGTVAAGGTYVDALLASALAAAATTAPLPALTKRERQILTLLSGGMTNEKAAKELGISAETVQSHVRNAMTKLDADTRTQAVATAIRQALIS